MAKKDDSLFDKLRENGLTKKAAETITDTVEKARGGSKAPKGLERITSGLRSLADEVEARATGKAKPSKGKGKASPAKAKSAARGKTAATRKTAANKTKSRTSTAKKANAQAKAKSSRSATKTGSRSGGAKPKTAKK